MHRASPRLAALVVCLLWPSIASSHPLLLPTSENPAGGCGVSRDSSSQSLLLPSVASVGSPDPAAPASMTAAPAQLQMEQALDEMLQRRNGRVVRWTRQPELVVLTSVMEYRPGAQTTYEATSERLDEKEVADLIGDLTSALRLLTADTFRQFAGVRLEDAPSGTRVNVLRPGQIVVGRYRGLRDRLNTVGLGGKVAYDAASIGAGLILLDRDYDRSSVLRRLLRTHELGHALGYRHVESSSSIMNPRIGAEPTDVDRHAALVAFQGMAAASVSCPTS